MWMSSVEEETQPAADGRGRDERPCRVGRAQVCSIGHAAYNLCSRPLTGTIIRSDSDKCSTTLHVLYRMMRTMLTHALGLLSPLCSTGISPHAKTSDHDGTRYPSMVSSVPSICNTGTTHRCTAQTECAEATTHTSARVGRRSAEETES